MKVIVRLKVQTMGLCSNATFILRSSFFIEADNFHLSGLISSIIGTEILTY